MFLNLFSNRFLFKFKNLSLISKCTKYSPSAFKSTQKTSSFGRLKTTAVTKTKKYKLKTHKGAAARWMVMGDGLFKRGQVGRNHFNSKMRTWKRKSKKRKVLATPMQKRRLRVLMPYFRKKYSK